MKIKIFNREICVCALPATNSFMRHLNIVETKAAQKWSKLWKRKNYKILLYKLIPKLNKKQKADCFLK